MAKDDKKIEEVDGVPREREGTRPDLSTLPARKKLPKELQDTLDNEEKMWEVMYEGRYVRCSSSCEASCCLLEISNTLWLKIRAHDMLASD